jgi:RecB family exonuclease
LIVAETREAAASLARAAQHSLGATFGWERTTIAALAVSLASPGLAARGLAPAGHVSIEALCDRVVGSKDGKLGRFSPIADRPGLCRALARTIAELRMDGVDLEKLKDHDLAEIALDYEKELALAKLADRAVVFSEAIAAANSKSKNPSLDVPVLFYDVSLSSAKARDLVAAIAARAPHVSVTIPAGDAVTEARFEKALGVVTNDLPPHEGHALGRMQANLFSAASSEARASGAEIEILSAPGESRECVEVARRILKEAEKGTPFDKIAIVARSAAEYRAHLVEAMRRAQIPAFFARGVRRPDPAGRALAALLSCAAEGLSARRFAEYLSLGELPNATASGEPPPPVPASENFVPPDEEMLPAGIERAIDTQDQDEEISNEPSAQVADPNAHAVIDGSLHEPAQWEKLLSDAAVIKGPDRWRRRLRGLQHQITADLKEIRDPEDAEALRKQRTLEQIDRLRNFALPIIDELDAFPQRATWGEWREALTRLATRALRHPDRVLSVLAQLAPMDALGGISLADVRLVLEERLCQLVDRPKTRRYGCVFIGEPSDVRGLVFDVVFVVGVAEKLFPRKVIEDPIFPDAARSSFDPDLATNATRTAAERLALRLAVGAAAQRVVVSYPRLDADQARPRTPSFYALEVLRAAEGKLPGFEELARRAEVVGGARIGWPAPQDRTQAIDETEHDLALLEFILKKPEAETTGMARFLLSANAHLARALRFRALRWQKGWSYADGLVLAKQPPEACAALEPHTLAARSFSPTALQHFAACPYKFVLQAIFRLSPRQEAVQIEELDPLQRGSLLHEIEFQLHLKLRDKNLLPVTAANLEEARQLLDEVVHEVSEKVKDDLAPSIPEVWDDGIRSLAADAREMLRLAADAPEWVPSYFELSFGLKQDKAARDSHSREEFVELENGLKLRGSIDVVEKNDRGELRATDYKTGKVRADQGMRIGGGETLQPVLYALVLEKLLPQEKPVGGRLYYCTAAGAYTEVEVPLDAEAREGVQAIVKTMNDAFTHGFLPAAPDPNPKKWGCTYCDYLPVCGPYEVQRTKKKNQKELGPLFQIRGRR